MAGPVRGSWERSVKLEAHPGIPLSLRYVLKRGGEECCAVNPSEHLLHWCLCSTAGSWSNSRTPGLLLGPGETRVCHGGFPLPLPTASSSHYHASAIAVAAAAQRRQEGLGSNQGLVRTTGGTTILQVLEALY